jgi:beta-galactosidase/beta-glucuronidase
MAGPLVARGYPRPQLRRADWKLLDGNWDFSIEPEARWQTPGDAAFEGQIKVPFAPETPESGVKNTGFFQACWYRRMLSPEEVAVRPGERLILHFGAIDHSAVVWIDGAEVVRHRGGYTPFEADIGDFVAGPGPHELVVRAHDDPFDLAKARGKQDWLLEPHSIWYPRTTGIWQSVWLERAPATRIEFLRWRTSLENWEICLDARIHGPVEKGMRLVVELRARGKMLANDEYAVLNREIHRRIVLSDPGIDDSRNELLWSPASPTLIQARLRLVRADGSVVDTVRSYTALRSIATQGDRFLLNGRPYPLRLVLDQGYWPETGLTAPDDAALRRDVELAKAMGFNGVRKHQKVEDPRYLYWADRLGLLVWAEMPSAYRFTGESVEALTTEWLAVLRRDESHPCIVAWVPFNESWGVPNLPDSARERHYVQALYHLTKTLDPTRPVIGNDGWESVATDIIGVHDYDMDLSRVAERYRTHEVIPRLLDRERPGGRVLRLFGSDAEHPIVLSEFGGIALTQGAGSAVWGYAMVGTERELSDRYAELLRVVRSLGVLSGFCYTQFSDTYQEANGLLYANRTPKFPLEQIAAATRGPRHLAPPSPNPLTAPPAHVDEEEWVHDDA